MRTFCLVIIMIMSAGTAWSNEAHLEPFETDYCTMFADGTPQKPTLWKHCCFEHDLRYWFGGTMLDRDFADEALKQCVQKVAGSFWANLIYQGVRDGHHSPVQHRTHWSWGWAPARANTPLSEPEKTIIREALGRLPLDADYVRDFILKYQLN